MSKETITVEVRSEVALAYLNAPAEQQKKMSRLFEICLNPEQLQARLDEVEANALKNGKKAAAKLEARFVYMYNKFEFCIICLD